MRLILEFDPWVERIEAQRAADALTSLGLPVQTVQVKPGQRHAAVGPVTFDPPPSVCTKCGRSPCDCRRIGAA